MVLVRKRDGTAQEFDRDKLELSMLKARANLTSITEALESVTTRITEGIETKGIRQLVITELQRLDPKAAERYETFRLIPA
jgi:transcriptional regulator NrdR family protein